MSDETIDIPNPEVPASFLPITGEQTGATEVGTASNLPAPADMPNVVNGNIPTPAAEVDTNAQAAIDAQAAAAAAATEAHPANSGASADVKPVIPGLSAERQAIVDADEAGDVVMDHAAMVAFVGDDAAFSTALDSGEFDVPDLDVAPATVADVISSEPVTALPTGPVGIVSDAPRCPLCGLQGGHAANCDGTTLTPTGPMSQQSAKPAIPDDATLEAATDDGLVMLMAAHMDVPKSDGREHAISLLKAIRDKVVAEVTKIEADVEAVWNKDLQAWVKKAV